jgi:hypothetical protein
VDTRLNVADILTKVITGNEFRKIAELLYGDGITREETNLDLVLRRRSQRQFRCSTGCDVNAMIPHG